MRISEGRLDHLEARSRALGDVKVLVNKQAEDDGLWFDAQTAPEAYLQQELRKLHGAVEEASKA